MEHYRVTVAWPWFADDDGHDSRKRENLLTYDSQSLIPVLYLLFLCPCPFLFAYTLNLSLERDSDR
jgi:hypothetical protein